MFAGAGLLAMWAGAAVLTAAMAIQVASPTAPSREYLVFLLPVLLIDLLCVRISLRNGPFASALLTFDGVFKTVVVMSIVMVVTSRRIPIVRSPLDDFVGPALLTGPLTILAGILRRLGR